MLAALIATHRNVVIDNAVEESSADKTQCGMVVRYFILSLIFICVCGCAVCFVLCVCVCVCLCEGEAETHRERERERERERRNDGSFVVLLCAAHGSGGGWARVSAGAHSLRCLKDGLSYFVNILPVLVLACATSFLFNTPFCLICGVSICRGVVGVNTQCTGVDAWLKHSAQVSKRG